MKYRKIIYPTLSAIGFGAFFAIRLSSYISENIISTLSAVMLLVGILGAAVTSKNNHLRDEK
jgi:hypothetical protein